MVTIYHLKNSRSERIVWLMEELGLPYTLEVFDRRNDLLAPDALRKVHPLGKSPVIRDGDVLLAESGAIVQYLLSRYGKDELTIQPSSPAYPDFLYWFHFAEGSAIGILTTRLIVNALTGAGAPNIPFVEEYVGGTIEAQLKHMEDTLSGRAYFAGDDFTAADIMMIFVFETVERFLGESLEAFPSIAAYRTRISDRAAYAKAMQVTGMAE
ncbi:MAG: glutathione S-transferase [Pseudomonadota bacterium]